MSASGEPLFSTDQDYGQTEHKTSGVLIALNVLLVLFELFTVSICVAFGIKNKSPEHFVMGAVAISIFAVFVTLMWWYRKGLLEEPRFKFLIILVLFGVLFASTAANMYVWKPLPIPESCQSSGYFFSVATQQCFEVVNMEKCFESIKGYCLFAINGDTPSIQCRNCSTSHSMELRAVLEQFQIQSNKGVTEVNEVTEVTGVTGVTEVTGVTGVMGSVEKGKRGVTGVEKGRRGVKAKRAMRGVLKKIGTDDNVGMEKENFS